MARVLAIVSLLSSLSALPAGGQGRSAAASAPERIQADAPAPRQDVLRGEYGRYRANNDLLSYQLDVRVDPERRSIAGHNAIRFRMVHDDTRIQLDLYENLAIDGILLGATPLTFERELNTVFVDFPSTLRAGRTYTIDFKYSGTPVEKGRFGGMTFRRDPEGRHWITTACEDEGASLWWPNKDQWQDEVETMQLSVSIPRDLTEVSNGKLVGKTDLGDGYTRWDWSIQYPINSYGVALNIGHYATFTDRLGNLPLDFFVLPENLERAQRQFAQTKPMLQAYEHYFGAYPFARDGFKLVEVPYAGMEHQSAIAYGNGFANGYLGRDFTGVGISPRFDFILVHESAHEWFGNAVSAADISDMWIHEGWATYLESLYVERLFGHDDAIRYLNGYRSRVLNREPVVTERGLHRTPGQDMYFKGALFLNTLRSITNDDERWWKTLRAFFQRFKYRNILTEDVEQFFSHELRRDLHPVFDQYLRHAAIPVLDLEVDTNRHTVSYRWKVDVPGFSMPVRIGTPGRWTIIEPTTEWKTIPTDLGVNALEAAADLYYVAVEKRAAR